jgi:hypothetical protein
MRPNFSGFVRPFQTEGECRMPGAPAASCAHGVVSMHTSIHSEVAGTTRHSPRDGLRLIACSPRRPGFLATVTRENDFADLMPASGIRTTRLHRPRQRCSSKAPPASTASRSNVRDDRDTPLSWARDGRHTHVIWVRRKQKYFCEGGWTGESRSAPVGHAPARYCS